MSNWKRKLLVATGCAALTAVGFVVIPPIINKVSQKLYRASSGIDDINLDDLGPEIVRKTDAQDDEA